MSPIDSRLASFADPILWMERRRVVKKSDRSAGASLNKAEHISSALQPRELGGAIRDHVRHLVRRTPQVMVKITGSAGDMKRVSSHLQYIQRSGRYRRKATEELPIETDSGQTLLGKEGRSLVEQEFAHGGSPIPLEVRGAETGSSRIKRETLHIVFSMPSSSGREPVKAAIRATAQRLFEGHQWVMVHHEDTDNQHAHVVVKMVGHDGVRMNPRKGDLERWRIEFAGELQARGVPAVATRRRARLQRDKGKSRVDLALSQRGIRPWREATAKTQPAAKGRALDNEVRFLSAYQGVAQVLAESGAQEDRQLAKALAAHFKFRISRPMEPGL